MNYFEGKNIFVEVPGTTAKLNERYQIYLKIATDYGFVDEAKVIINQQKGTNEREIRMNYITTEKKMNIFACEILLDNIGLHYFCMRLIINGKTIFIKNDKKSKCASMTNSDLPYWTITVYDASFKVPEWAKGKIMYQIFPDRFYKSENYIIEKETQTDEIPKAFLEERKTKKWGEMPNWAPEEDGEIHNNDYFMGNLKGIEEKLNYLQNLGVQIIYLNPICLSQSNHRYDTSNYEIVDPYLGKNDDLASLCKSAHEKNMKIIIDGVFNHTGNDSKYFNEFGNFETIGAFQSSQSPYYSWYRKNNKGEFDYWWGFKNLPVCDGNSTDWQNYIYGTGGVIDKWFSLGIDGLRLDVADELTDEFIENIRIAVKRNKPDGFIIGEVWDNAISKEGYGKQRTYLLGKGLDSVMNYPFTNAILKYVRFGRVDYLVETIQEIITQYPEQALFSVMNSLSTHDITRAMTTLVNDGIQNSRFNWVWDVPYSRELQVSKDKLTSEQYEKAKQLMKIATTIQYFLPGNPCIYYGDEVGMYGYKDPFNRKCFPWENIDNEIHEFFVKLGKARNRLSFLSKSKMRIIEANENLFVFERYVDIDSDDADENEAKTSYNKVLIAVNRSESNIQLNFPQNYDNGKILFKNNFSDNILSKYGIIVITSK